MLRRDIHILDNYILHRRNLPFLCSYKITYACNLSCLQCPFPRLHEKQPSFLEVCQTLELLYRRGNRIIIFEGGEPTLWKDENHSIREVIQEAKKRFLRVGITTNGTQTLDLPADIIWVSLDGLKETHNRLRKAEVFDQVIENIRQSAHPNIYAHLTINNQNYLEIPDLIRFLHSIVKGITIQFYYPYHHQDSLFLDFENREPFLDELIALKRSGFRVLNSQASLRALKHNHWKCQDWLIDCTNPDGSFTQGCYLKGRDDIDCSKCGFSPYTEISLAYRGNLQAIRAGLSIFFG